MTEQSNIWKPKQGDTSRRCLKHGITVSGCTLFYDCKDCIKAEKDSNNASNEPNKRRQEPKLQPHTESSSVKKRTRMPRIRPIIGQTSGKEPEKVSKDTGHCRIRRRTRSPNRRRNLK